MSYDLQKLNRATFVQIFNNGQMFSNMVKGAYINVLKKMMYIVIHDQLLILLNTLMEMNTK